MAMSMSDQSKALAAGLILYRMEIGEKKIKVARKPGSWKTYDTFSTQVECKKAWDNLMRNYRNISG